jgi:D-aminopeptidase
MAEKRPPAEPATVQSPPTEAGSSISDADVPRETLVLRWLGDEGVFVNGVPNRDVTLADGLGDDVLELAILCGTHTRA